MEVKKEDVHEDVHALAHFMDRVGHWDELLEGICMVGKPEEVPQALQTTLRRHGQSSRHRQSTGNAQQRTWLNVSMKGQALLRSLASAIDGIAIRYIMGLGIVPSWGGGSGEGREAAGPLVWWRVASVSWSGRCLVERAASVWLERVWLSGSAGLAPNLVRRPGATRPAEPDLLERLACVCFR